MTLRATVRGDRPADGVAAGAVNAFLRGFRPACLMLDGVHALVAYRGAVFVTLSAASDACALAPDVLISASGPDACDAIEEAAGELFSAVTDAEPSAVFTWEELAPREFGHV